MGHRAHECRLLAKQTKAKLNKHESHSLQPTSPDTAQHLITQLHHNTTTPLLRVAPPCLALRYLRLRTRALIIRRGRHPLLRIKEVGRSSAMQVPQRNMCTAAAMHAGPARRGPPQGRSIRQSRGRALRRPRGDSDFWSFISIMWDGQPLRHQRWHETASTTTGLE